MAGDNKTEQATPRRRQKARERGQVPRSRELSAALSLLAVVLFLWWQPQLVFGPWREFFSRLLSTVYHGELGLGTPLFNWTGILLFRSLAPVLLLAWTVSLTSSLAQGGMVFATEAFVPNFDRLNPASNLRNLFSLAGLSRLLQSLIPAGVMVFIVLSMAERDADQILRATRLWPRPLLSLFGSRLFEFSWKAGLVLLIWSGFDYFLQRWHYERSLRMTREEVREEMKDTEGNPLVRGRLRRLRRELRRRRMMRDVARANVVVTNPNEFAVALEYRPETMPAPVVVAKGRNLLAQRIKQAARWHEIPIVENPPLAQALYRAVEVGQAIPANLYAAVAEILAFIYRIQARMKARSAASTAADAAVASEHGGARA